jgi:hypothetical protein
MRSTPGERLARPIVLNPPSPKSPRPQKKVTDWRVKAFKYLRHGSIPKIYQTCSQSSLLDVPKQNLICFRCRPASTPRPSSPSTKPTTTGAPPYSRTYDLRQLSPTEKMVPLPLRASRQGHEEPVRRAGVPWGTKKERCVILAAPRRARCTMITHCNHDVAWRLVSSKPPRTDKAHSTYPK